MASSRPVAAELATIEVHGLTREAFLLRSTLAAGAAYGTLSATGLIARALADSGAGDVDILNYALTLEFLEAAFYKQAVANQAFGSSAPLKAFAETVAEHEAKHVAFLKKALGSAAIKSPTFDFADAVTDQAKFAATAQVLEDTGVSAYLGQVGNLSQRAVLAAAGTIATVEARHAAWIRDINGSNPAPASFDVPASEKATLKAVTATGFIK